MSTKNAKCQVERCQRFASALCFCCQKNVCSSHMLEHIDNMQTKMNPLANQVNRTMERIRNLTIDQLSRPVFIQLDQWRKEMHASIEDIHRRETKQIEAMLTKNKEIFDEHKRQQSEAMMKLQEDVRQLVEDGDVTFEQIESLENQLRQIESN